MNPPPPTPSETSTWPADVILHNANGRALDRPGHTFTALAIKDGRVLEIGESDQVLALAGPATRVEDIQGRNVLPGLTDAHLHMKTYSRSLAEVACDTVTIEACLDRLQSRAAALAKGRWVLGHGWDQNRWGRFGTRQELDAVLPNHPAYLTARSLHAAWCNSAALAAAGIAAGTPDPPGGLIQRDADGSPTGVLLESAMHLVGDYVHEAGSHELDDDLLAAQSRLWSLGLTGIHDFDDAECFDALQRLRESGRLGLRVVKQVLAEYLDSALDLGLHTGFGDEWIRIGNIKVFADGALGPHTAAMLSPYAEEPANLGILLKDAEDILAIAQPAAQGGLAMTIHAIGDRANHEVLNAYEQLRAFEKANGLPRYRHRIEHLQLLHPQDLGRPSELGVMASMQPIHALSDREMADRHWGERVEFGYAWRTQLDQGAKLAFGSDAPVEDPNPFLGLYAAVTRAPLPGTGEPVPWIPNQRLSLWEALQAYTFGPAYAAGQEAHQGRLLPGTLADLIVLDEDLFTLPPEALAGVQVAGTMVAGEWRFRRF